MVIFHSYVSLPEGMGMGDGDIIWESNIAMEKHNFQKINHRTSSN